MSTPGESCRTRWVLRLSPSLSLDADSGQAAQYDGIDQTNTGMRAEDERLDYASSVTMGTAKVVGTVSSSIASAGASLRLLTRLTAGVRRLPARYGMINSMAVDGGVGPGAEGEGS